MPNDRRRHYRLTLDEALDAHAHALCFGGRQGVIDLGSIKSAIARPYSGYYRTIGREAAALVGHTLLASWLDGRGQLRSHTRSYYCLVQVDRQILRDLKHFHRNTHALAGTLA